MRRPFVTVCLPWRWHCRPPIFTRRTRRPPGGRSLQRPRHPSSRSPAEAGILLVQIKPDQTAVFEEMVAKLKAGLAKTEDATLKQQAAGFKVYKTAEPFGANALYVVMIEPRRRTPSTSCSACCRRS